MNLLLAHIHHGAIVVDLGNAILILWAYAAGLVLMREAGRR